MKKLVFAFVTLAALSMSVTSCDWFNKKPAETPNPEGVVDTLNKDTADSAATAEATAETADAEKAPEAADEAKADAEKDAPKADNPTSEEKK